MTGVRSQVMRVALGVVMIACGVLFFFQGLYLLVRPIELGFGEFVDLGPTQQNVYFNLNVGAGFGYAF